MWTSRTTQLSNGRVIKLAIDIGSSPVSYADVIHQWQNDAGFRSFFIDLLLDSPFSAFRWETPPITTATANHPFEFVLLNSPDLESDPDPAASQCKSGWMILIRWNQLNQNNTLNNRIQSGPAILAANAGR